MNLDSLKLSSRIIVLVAIPYLAFLWQEGQNLSTSWSQSSAAEAALKNKHVISSVSNLVNEL